MKPEPRAQEAVRAPLAFTFVDWLLALALGSAYVALLLGTVEGLGYARDEGFYFQAARAYEAWFELLQRQGTSALSPDVADRYWVMNHEHPALIKTLFALSHRYLWSGLQLFREQGTAYRFPAMVLSGIGVSTLYAWGAREMGRMAGLVAALAFALMPRVFFHAHLACFDMPVATLLLLTTYAYARSLRGGVGSAIATGVLYGLLLDTKHNAWLLPGAFLLHFALTGLRYSLDAVRAKRLPFPRAYLALLVLSPLVFYLGWPWIWHDTLPRLRDYVAFHTGHEYYNMEFLGRTYWKPPMPRLYAWVMTLATVPGITLVLFAVGLVASARRAERSQIKLLWIVGLLTCYAPWWSDATPIFGGTKHWITAYPFLCLFAGQGFSYVASELRSLLGGHRRYRSLRAGVSPLLAGCVLVGPLCMTLHSEPWGLSFYTPLVGGAPGAASLGLNRTFWGYTTGALQGFINHRAPPNANVYVHDTALQSFDMMQRDGRIRRDLRGTLALAGSDLALYHHEPHMRRVEYQTWIDYGHATPAELGTFDGVPIIWVYAR